MEEDKLIKSFSLTAEQKKENLNAALLNASLLVKSIGPHPTSGLDEIARFPGDTKFFDLQKMKDYIDETFIPTTSANQKSTSGSQIVEMANNFSAGISVSGSYGFACGAALSGSMSTDFASSQNYSSETKFSQTRITLKFGSISLPPPIKREALRNLASASTLRIIDSCDSFDKAKEIVGPDGLGALYIRNGTFGAILAMSTFSESTEFSSSEELEAAVSAEASYLTASVSTNNKFSIGKQKGKKNTNMEINVVSSGGDPAAILKGNIDAWLESTKSNPIMSSFSLAPISDLAIKGSNAEMLLREAVKEVSLYQLGKFTTFHPPSSKDSLYYDEKLTEGQELKSPNGKYRLFLHSDGNLVGYMGDVNASASRFWAANTDGKGKGPYYVIMQKDGNVVLYSRQGCCLKDTWTTRTYGKPGYRFAIQDDRNIVLRSYEGAAVWSSGTRIK